MDEQLSLLPIPDETNYSAPESLLPEPDAVAPTRVPKNTEEVAAQIALASGTDFRTNVSSLKAGGVQPLLSAVMEKEFDDTISAAKSQALAFAQVQDAARSEFAARTALAAEHAKSQADPDRDGVVMQQASAVRSLEHVGTEFARRYYKDMEVFDRVLQGAAGDVAIRNINALVASDKPEPSLWDHAKYFFGSLIPYGYDARANANIAKVTGGTVADTPYGAITALRDHLLGLTGPERKAVLDKLWQEDFGIWGDNLAAKVDFFRKVGELTKNEANVDALVNGLGLLDVAALTKGLYAMIRKGTPLKAIQDVAGEKKAGEVAADELLNKVGYAGLNDAELVSRVIAAGRLPWSVDPAATRGLSAAAQSKLSTDWNSLLDGIRAKLNSSGMSADEIQEAAARIRASYTGTSNKAIFDVEFGEASADGLNLTLLWQNKSGKAFSSKEAAEKWAIEAGLDNYTVIAKGDLDQAVTRAQQAFHGGTATNTLDETFIGQGQGGGALGRGFYMSNAEELATRYAEKYGHTLSKWDIPENNMFLHWYAKAADQPSVVQKAAIKILGKDADLAHMEGMDIYRAVSDKLGGENAANAALRKEGVVGNFAEHSGPHGTGPEHMLYSGKDAKYNSHKPVPRNTAKPKEEEPITIDGETFYSKAQDVVKEWERQYAKQPHVVINPKAKTAVSRGDFLFERGKTVEFSDYFESHPKLKGMVEGWLDLFRLSKKDGHEFVFATQDDIGALSKSLLWNGNTAKRVYDVAFNAYGTHTVMRPYNGKTTHVITINPQRGRDFRYLASTLAHEMGHAFDYAVLRNAPPLVRQEMKKDFRKWLDAHAYNNTNSVDFETLFRVPTQHSVDYHKAARDGAPGLQERSAADMEWYGHFSEYWAENFAKFALTDARPLNVVEKFFADYVQKLKEFFRQVAKQLGFDASEADPMIASLLDHYLKNPTRWDQLLKQGDDALGEVPGASYQSKAHGKKKATPTGEWLVKQTKTDPLSYDSVGKYSAKDIESMPFIAIDPKHGASEQAVEGRVVGVHAEAKVKNALTKFIEPYYKGLGRDGTRRVQSLLEEGDSFSNAGGYGKEFTYMEARGKGLNDKEALAYLATRQLRMAMYHIRNGEMVRHLHAMGLREVELHGAGVKAAGRDLSAEAAAKHTNTWLYDAVDKKTYQLTELGMTEAYAKGKRLVQLEHPVKVDGQLRQLMLVDDSVATTRDIKTALHYRPGEFSRVYTDEYFIRMRRTQKVDGVDKDVITTIRTAASAREAEDFTRNVQVAIGVLKNAKAGVDTRREVEKLIGNYFDTDEFIKSFDNGDYQGFRGLDYHYTRNKEEYLNGSVAEAIANGRLFTSKRSERLFSTDATRANTLGVFESLEAEITNVSRVSNINQWRETNVRRWMNTFGHLLPTRTGNDVADFFSAAGSTFTKGGPDSVFAERTHKYIMRQIGLRTGEERYYEQLTRRMTEKYFTGNERIESVGAKIRQQSILGLVRNINFNLTLGMFNPAQLIVQANGAATAMMLSPIHGMAAAKTFPLLRMALMSDNPDVWKWFGKAEKGLFGSEEEFVKLVGAVRQTGLIDNLRSTSLYNLEDGALNIFGAYPSKVIGSSTFFFNRGEEFSRLVSFDVARREWIKAHPEMDWTSKEALAAMVVRADDFTQNMTKANLARFQEGAMSVPLQFAQYNIKLAANVMSSLLGKGEGRGFTKAEAVQLMAGHVLMYGAAGTGLAALVEEVVPKNVLDTMSVEAKTYLGQGLLAGLLNQAGEFFTGERTNVALGSRLGSFNYYAELGRAVFNDPKNVYEALMGPSLSTAKRLGVVGEVAALWWKDPELTGADVLQGLKLITTEQVASLRNASKAYLFHQHADKLLDKNGVAIAQLTPTEVLAQALGFQPTAMVDVSSLIRSKKDHTEALTDIASTIYKVQKQIMDARARGDHAYADEQHKLLQVLWPTNAGDMMEVQRIVRDRLYPYDTEFQKLMGDYLWKGQTYQRPLTVTSQPEKE